MPVRQNFASILKSLKGNATSKTLLHPINESGSEESLAQSHESTNSIKQETFVVKRNSVKFQQEIPTLASQYLKDELSHYTLTKNTDSKQNSTPVDSKLQDVPSNNKTNPKPVYFPSSQQSQVKKSTSIKGDGSRQRSSKLIKLNKKVIILPYSSIFDDYSSSRASSAKSSSQTTTTTTPKNTINHFFPKLFTKTNSEPILRNSEYKKTDIMNTVISLSPPESTPTKATPLRNNSPTPSVYSLPINNQTKLHSSLRLSSDTKTLSDDYENYADLNNETTIVTSTNVVNSRRLPFLDNIYIKPYHEKRFYDRHPDLFTDNIQNNLASQRKKYKSFLSRF